MGLPNTKLNLMKRKYNKIQFAGIIPDNGAGYIIIDDQFTPGATLRELGNHIIKQGGRILAATTLSCGRFGKSFIRQSNGQFIGMTGVEYQAIKLYGRKT